MPEIAACQLNLHMSHLPSEKDPLTDDLLSSNENDTSVALISRIDSFLQSLSSSHRDYNNSNVTERIQTNVKESNESSRTDSLNTTNSEEIQFAKAHQHSPSSSTEAQNLKHVSCSLETDGSTCSGSNEKAKIPNENDHVAVEKRKSDTTESIVTVSKNKADRQRNSQSSPNYSSFPFTLFLLLEEASVRGYEQIVSWQPHGQSFRVHNQTAFVTSVMPQYFQQTRFSSFQRQLALYGFVRFNNKGLDQGAYYHRHFIRGYPQLCSTIQRTPIKGTGFQRQMFMKNEPDFYQMHAVTNLPQASSFLTVTDPLALQTVPTRKRQSDHHPAATKYLQPHLPLVIPGDISRNDNIVSGQSHSYFLIPNNKLSPSLVLQGTTTQAIQETRDNLVGSNDDIVLDRIGRGISIIHGGDQASQKYQESPSLEQCLDRIGRGISIIHGGDQASQKYQESPSLEQCDIEKNIQHATIRSMILPPSEDAFDRLRSSRLEMPATSISNRLQQFASFANEQQDINTNRPIVEIGAILNKDMIESSKAESEDENSTLASFLADVDLDSDH